MHRRLAWTLPYLAFFSLAACSSAPAEKTPEAIAGPTSDLPACAAGATRCEGDRVATCTGGTFGAAVACEGDSVCREGTCRAPSAQQLAQAAELASMVTYLQEETAWTGPLDWNALRENGRKAILGGDGSDLAYATALYHAFVAVPEGHQALSFGTQCGSLVPTENVSQRGACGQPHSRGIVVTATRPGNPLGLAPGDVVVRVGDARGAALLASLADRPMCVGSRPSTSNRDATTAATFTDLLHAGEELEVEAPDGTTRTIQVPSLPLANTKDALSCADPFARRQVPVESMVRPDGIGVIRLPNLTDPEQKLPTTANSAFDTYVANFEAKIQAAFDKVKNAPAIVWDIRGNRGGVTKVGLAIVSGFPGARPDALSYCEARIPKTSPPAFDTTRYAEYALTPGGPFAYAGKVAVLIDGQNYSAADYFPLAAKARTSATLVGAPTAGAYGAISATKTFAGPPRFDVSVDVNRCSSAEDGVPLEGKSTTPHVTVEYDPADLAAGRDTVLERAAALLK